MASFYQNGVTAELRPDKLWANSTGTKEEDIAYLLLVGRQHDGEGGMLEYRYDHLNNMRPPSKHDASKFDVIM